MTLSLNEDGGFTWYREVQCCAIYSEHHTPGWMEPVAKEDAFLIWRRGQWIWSLMIIDYTNTTDCYDDQKWNFKTESNTSRMGCRYFKHVFVFCSPIAYFLFLYWSAGTNKVGGLIGIWNNIWRTKEWISFSLFAVYYIFYIFNKIAIYFVDRVKDFELLSSNSVQP